MISSPAPYWTLNLNRWSSNLNKKEIPQMYQSILFNKNMFRCKHWMTPRQAIEFRARLERLNFKPVLNQFKKEMI
jgi:hypothetical protein